MTDRTEALEFPFAWTCPKCGHAQTDTVHPDYGPFLNCTCGNCQRIILESELDTASIAAWDVARDQADKARAD